MALESLVTVEYEEVDGSPIEVYTDTGFEANRILQCAFADRLTLSEQLRGGTRLVGGAYVYTKPQEYPHYSAAVVHDVRIEPFGATVPGADSSVVEYELARLNVAYRIPQHSTEDDEETLIFESLEPAVEFLTLPHEKFYWDDQGTDQLSESEAPGRLLRMLDWVYTRYKLISIPVATLNLVGKVNDSAMVSKTLGLSFPAQTLLYNPPQLEREITTEGVKAWRVTYRFTYRPETWNKFPRRGSQTMQTIYKKEGESYTPFQPYEPGDFSVIVG